MRRISFPDKPWNEHTTTQKTKQNKTKNWNRRPAFLQTTKKACTTREARTRSGRCQFSQNIHDFSQEKLYELKLLAQHDKRKSPSVMWQISFPDKPWNEHTTTKTIGTEDLRVYREQRRATPHAQRWLASRRVQACPGQPVAGRLACNLSVHCSPVLNSSAIHHTYTDCSYTENSFPHWKKIKTVVKTVNLI